MFLLKLRDPMLNTNVYRDTFEQNGADIGMKKALVS